MSNLFWGLRLEPGKRYSTTVDKSFHVSMATLDCTSVKSDDEILSVMFDEGESNVPFILCNLQKSSVIQSPLDLNYMTGDKITIFCKGNGIVHLSGYIVLDDVVDDLEQLGEEEDDDEDDEEAEEASDDEEVQVTKGKGKVNGLRGKRRLEGTNQRQPKRKKLGNMDEDTDDSDDDDDDDDFGSDDMEDENTTPEGGAGDDDDDDDDDELDDESDDEPTKLTTIKQQDKKNKPKGNQQKGVNNKQNIPNLNKQQSGTNTNKQQQNQTSSRPTQNKKQNQQNNPNLNKQQNKGKQQQKKPNGLTPNMKTKKR